MKYNKVTFLFEPSAMDPSLLETARDMMAGLVASVGFESFEECENGIVGYVQSDFLDKELLQDTVTSFPMPGVTASYIIEEMEDKDWNETWEEEGFEPIRIGNRCVIHDTKHPIEDNNTALDIVIDAKMAFGTGTHETTYMVVEQLLDSELQGKHVLDCGCGTGILSIVASKLGAADVVAYDIDEWSVENTCHNMSLNGVSNIEVLTGDCNILSHVSGVFDVVMANINRNVLLSDMPAFREVMSSKSLLILSGFYEEDTPLLIEKAQELGLTLHKKTHNGEWFALSFTT